jgi:hypothetical protein
MSFGYERIVVVISPLPWEARYMSIVPSTSEYILHTPLNHAEQANSLSQTANLHYAFVQLCQLR